MQTPEKLGELLEQSLAIRKKRKKEWTGRRVDLVIRWFGSLAEALPFRESVRSL